MERPQPLYSEYEQLKHRTILTAREMGIPGLEMIGHTHIPAAAERLMPHIHPGCMEFVLMLKGTQRYFADGTEHLIFGGDLFTSFVDQPHGNGGELQDICEIAWFQLDLRAREDFLGLCPAFAERLLSMLSRWDRPVYRTCAAQRRILKQALKHFFAGTQEGYYLGTVKMVDFLNSFLASVDKPAVRDGMPQVLRYIDEHLDRAPELSELARVCGLSESHFKHKFAEDTGMTPRYYVNLKRVERAKQLLLRPGAAVVDTAFALGFESSSYFAAVFRKFTGITPSEYIRRHK